MEEDIEELPEDQKGMDDEEKEEEEKQAEKEVDETQCEGMYQHEAREKTQDELDYDEWLYEQNARRGWHEESHVEQIAERRAQDDEDARRVEDERMPLVTAGKPPVPTYVSV